MERRKPNVTRKVRLRTLDDLDKRTSAARAAFEMRNALVTDLGGSALLSSMQMALVENSAVMGAMLNDMASRYLAGEGKIDLGLFATIANAQRRLLADLGLERRARDITPDLRNYIRGRAA